MSSRIARRRLWLVRALRRLALRHLKLPHERRVGEVVPAHVAIVVEHCMPLHDAIELAHDTRVPFALLLPPHAHAAAHQLARKAQELANVGGGRASAAT